MNTPALTRATIPTTSPPVTTTAAVPGIKTAEKPCAPRFSRKIWFEDLAVRPNGDLLITECLTGAALHTVVSPSRPFPPAATAGFCTLANLTSTATNCLSAFAEVAPDRFVTAGVLLRGPSAAVPGTAKAFAVDFRGGGRRRSDGPHVEELGPVPGVVLPLGVAALDADTVLIGDSATGTVRAFSLRSRTLGPELLAVPEMAPPAAAGAVIGMVDIKVRAGYLYFSNGLHNGAWRVRINRGGRPVPGASVERVVGGLGYTWIERVAFDDRQGDRLWSSTMPNNSVVVTERTGRNTYALGANNSIVAAGVTGLGFGRTVRDRETLYACTNGGLLIPVNDKVVEPGKVSRIDTRGF
jgi:hypothetical protein